MGNSYSIILSKKLLNEFNQLVLEIEKNNNIVRLNVENTGLDVSTFERSPNKYIIYYKKN